MEFVKNVKKNKCHDCQKEIEFSRDKILNGLQLSYDNGEEKLTVFKCKECYNKNPGLANFQSCEVYSRIVGYLRPVNQWNRGKQQEFTDRKTFDMMEKKIMVTT